MLHQASAPHTPITMPTLLITARTVVRQRSDICIPTMLANAAMMISRPGRISTASGKTIHWDVASDAFIKRSTS